MRHYSYLLTLISLSLVSLLFTFTVKASTTAQQKSFRQEFIEMSQAMQFDALANLVKKNKEIIPAEIRSLIDEAMAENRRFEERIGLLDIAMRMATMYNYWHGGGETLVKEIESLQDTEIEKYKKWVEEATKWERIEKKYIGNLILREKIKEMSGQGLAPVVYPHWLHRIWFKCKVCHDTIFNKERGSNRITKAQIFEGKQCGVCHNNTIAFGPDRECERCHMAGKPEANRLFDIRNYDQNKIKEVALRLGAVWNIENLPGKSIPIDRYNVIGWPQLKEMNVINPLPSLDKEVKEEFRETRIFFETKSMTTEDVLFDHKAHSWWLNCSTCHNKIFIDRLGANDVRMTDMSKGKNCGSCHGKVSFSFADCLRCHNQPKGEIPKDALIRTRTGTVPPPYKRGPGK